MNKKIILPLIVYGLIIVLDYSGTPIKQSQFMIASAMIMGVIAGMNMRE